MKTWYVLRADEDGEQYVWFHDSRTKGWKVDVDGTYDPKMCSYENIASATRRAKALSSLPGHTHATITVVDREELFLEFDLTDDPFSWLASAPDEKEQKGEEQREARAQKRQAAQASDQRIAQLRDAFRQSAPRNAVVF